MTVPSVTGLTLAKATAKLEAAGFNIRANGKDLTEAEVSAISQSPAAGSLAEMGSVVTVDFVHESESEWVSVDY
ncbi:MAG: PASTA domain-containing protein [Clostridia bacterium]|nr:PASTA domain-containing protein [Clostridia bacterium]